MSITPASWRNWSWPQNASVWRISYEGRKAPRDRLWAAVWPDDGRGRVPAPPGGFRPDLGRCSRRRRGQQLGPPAKPSEAGSLGRGGAAK